MNVKCAFLNGELEEEVLCTIVHRLWISESRGLCISSLQGSQQTRVSQRHGMTLYLILLLENHVVRVVIDKTLCSLMLKVYMMLE